MSVKQTIFLFAVLFKTSFCAAQVQLKNLSLEEKVGQLLLVQFHGEKANEEAELLLKQAHVGGFIYYNWSNGLTSPVQVQALSASLQQMNKRLSSKIPLFLAVDQEGGKVARLKQGFTQFPSAQEIGQTEQPEIAFKSAKITARELKAVGINMNLAPVVDVNSASKKGIIGNRSYGTDPKQVFLFGKQALKGYQSEGILAVLKHFPGHGDVTVDPHHATPRVDKTLEELQKVDLFPFQKLSSRADALMTAHLLVKSIDPALPTTLSAPLLTDLLRKQWHYEGLVISDSLVMKGILPKTFQVEQVALLALQAGTDILCLGGKLLNETAKDELTPADVVRTHAFIVEAVRNGAISEKRIDESVARILRMKEKYASLNIKVKNPTSAATTLEGAQLVHEISILNNLNASLTKETRKKIANQIWKNETGAASSKILFWNPKEDFLSLGIAHMIWYPSSSSKIYEEGFPKYLAFLQSQGVSVPSWLASSSGCPWKNREEFISEKNASRRAELQRWLLSTFDLQALYLISELKGSLYRIIKETPNDKKQHLLNNLSSLTASPEGLYALTDYLNFKGSGLSNKERYRNKGWGLYQVLTEMSSAEDKPCLERFAEASNTVLTQRVQNAPSARKEEQWLQGWLNRVKGYKQFTAQP